MDETAGTSGGIELTPSVIEALVEEAERGYDLAVTADALAEARVDRYWRHRCGEPAPGRSPVRCRRDLVHPSPHVGIAYRLVEHGSRDARGLLVGRVWGDHPVTWPGDGNPVSAQVGGNDGFKCWCP